MWILADERTNSTWLYAWGKALYITLCLRIHWKCCTDWIINACQWGVQSQRQGLRTHRWQQRCVSHDYTTRRMFIFSKAATEHLQKFLWNSYPTSFLKKLCPNPLLSPHPRPSSPPAVPFQQYQWGVHCQGWGRDGGRKAHILVRPSWNRYFISP